MASSSSTVALPRRGQGLSPEVMQFLDDLNPTDRQKMIEASKWLREKPRPNRETHRVEWNAHYERQLLNKYGSGDRSPEAIAPEDNTSLPSWGYQSGDIEVINHEIALQTRELMRWEGALINLALDLIAYRTFEKDWVALESTRREELVLEGLYRGAAACPEDNRDACPELTIGGLVGDGEYNLIHLLKRLIDHDPTGDGSVKEPFFFAHPYVDCELRCPGSASDILKARVHLTVLIRNLCIVHTLLGTLKAHCNLPVRELALSKPVRNRTDQEKQETRRCTRNLTTALEMSGFPVEELKSHSEAQVLYSCVSCKNTSKARNAMRVCGKCFVARYCSPECQRKDWPEHKKLSGLRAFDPNLFVPIHHSPKRFIGRPDPVDGFVRSSALWRQIAALSASDSQTQDYHVGFTFQLLYLPRNSYFLAKFQLNLTGLPLPEEFRPKSANARTRSIRIEHPPGAQIVFLVARRRAMASGSLAAVQMMVDIVGALYVAQLVSLTPDQIRRQFAIEYGAKITREEGVVGAGPWMWPTKQELDEERAFLKQRLEGATYREEGAIGTLPTRSQVAKEQAYQQGRISLRDMYPLE
ncbi:hypothetical protein C8R46DRAFT_1300677 [Mycena filopes]|nr:hypothetical protein C8R46DRAFT_1300677 [Mycena filopes]